MERPAGLEPATTALSEQKTLQLEIFLKPQLLRALTN